MTKDEALKLALEALAVKFSEGWHEGIKIDASDIMLLNDAAQALAQQEQEPVALFKWLPEGATHIGRMSVRTAAGGSLEMTTHAFKYDSAVLKVYVTDNDNEYPGWRDAKDCFFHLNFPVLPLYTTPPQRTWVGLTAPEQLACYDLNPARFASAIEAKLKEKNT